MINVAAIDDHPVFLDGFAHILAGLNMVGNVSIYATHNGLLQDLQQQTPDILFTDLRMPHKDGFALCSELKATYPEIYLVALTSYDKRLAEKAFKHGADAFMSKDIDIEFIEQFFNDFDNNNMQIQPVYGGQVFTDNDKHDVFVLIETLTTREKQIMNMEAKGMKRNEIIKALNISGHTYKSHIMHIRAKLNLKGVSELISFASRHFPIK